MVSGSYIALLAFGIVLVCAVQGLVAFFAVRKVVATLREINQKYDDLRHTQLEEFLKLQREANARLVADTRLATAKMNVMADALWDGLQPTVREVPDGSAD